MCIFDPISCDCDCLMSSTGLPTAPTLHADARIRERINCQYTYTAGHVGPMSTDVISSLRFAVISATKEPLESTGNEVDMKQPPPHVVDYWFDQLGLSLDLTSPENPSNPTSSASRSPPFDSTIYVS